MEDDSSDEEPTISVGTESFRLSSHAVRRMQERGIDPDDVTKTIRSGQFFRYSHEGVWKNGYYDPEDRIFVGVVGQTIATIIKGVSENYIANLRAGAP